MPEVRDSDDWHSTVEYFSASEVFSTRQGADGRVAELAALRLAGVPVQEQPQQKPKQKKRAYGAGKRKKALNSKAVRGRRSLTPRLRRKTALHLTYVRTRGKSSQSRHSTLRRGSSQAWSCGGQRETCW